MNWFDFELSAFLWVFILLNLVNVVIQTVKSIATIKCGAWSAAVINAVAYGLYTIVVIYMNLDGLGIVWKAVIIGIANLLGVYVVKVVEEKKKKDKLWLVKMTVKKDCASSVHKFLNDNDIPCTIYMTDKYYVFDCFCSTQKQTEQVKSVGVSFGGKLFATENKLVV